MVPTVLEDGYTRLGLAIRDKESLFIDSTVLLVREDLKTSSGKKKASSIVDCLSLDVLLTPLLLI